MQCSVEGLEEGPSTGLTWITEQAFSPVFPYLWQTKSRVSLPHPSLCPVSLLYLFIYFLSVLIIEPQASHTCQARPLHKPPPHHHSTLHPTPYPTSCSHFTVLEVTACFKVPLVIGSHYPSTETTWQS